MKTLNASEARANLYRLIEEAARQHEPIQITGKRHHAVLISEDDWSAIQETLYLLSVPGMRASILEGLSTPLNETSKDPGW
ncbi:MAG: type II toxin-antitoxin system Phd/YefM family antitoxin [Candidatus Dadabacteria bacterium]|nr:MAG: type II toxin-antitoxin system Phd/YefM family antitoxin [Candidatus Dadabacteria bacterium]